MSRGHELRFPAGTPCALQPPGESPARGAAPQEERAAQPGYMHTRAMGRMMGHTLVSNVHEPQLRPSPV
jgi:hypothetical protein